MQDAPMSDDLDERLVGIGRDRRAARYRYADNFTADIAKGLAARPRREDDDVVIGRIGGDSGRGHARSSVFSGYLDM